MLINIFVLLPVVMIYLFHCATTAVDHFSDGFMALHPGGFTVEVRKYVRNDGKTIELFPMSHVADAGFYQQVSQTFPTNSIILMEGVTDNENLLTNKLSYKRMAKSLGLTEQKKEFEPTNGEMVRADVDVDQFSTNTIGLLNLVTLLHSKGLNAGTLLQLMQYAPSPVFKNNFLMIFSRSAIGIFWTKFIPIWSSRITSWCPGVWPICRGSQRKSKSPAFIWTKLRNIM